jgi:hypothetical protein
MQIFIRLSTGKTISMDVTKETILFDIINYANQYSEQEGNIPYRYNQIMLIEDYGNLLTVRKTRFLDPSTSLISIYVNGFIKEVIFIVV